MNARAIPDDNPKTVFGLKKPPMHFTPPVAEMHLGLAMQNGGAKYGMMNWREKTVSSSVYYDAARRHLAAWWDGEDVAPDSKVHHLGHVMACCAILLDAESVGKLNDDRPTPGAFATKMAELVDAAMAAVEGEDALAAGETAGGLAKFKAGDRVVQRVDSGWGGVAVVRRVVVALDFTSYDIEFELDDLIGNATKSKGAPEPRRVAEDDLAPAPRFRIGDIVIPRRSRPHWSSPHDELIGRRCRVDRYGTTCSDDGTPLLVLSGEAPDARRNLLFGQDNVDPAPKFKVGDRVIDREGMWDGPGTIVCGVAHNRTFKYAVMWDGNPTSGWFVVWTEERLAPAPAEDGVVSFGDEGIGDRGVATTLPKFKVGDRVRRRGRSNVGEVACVRPPDMYAVKWDGQPGSGQPIWLEGDLEPAERTGGAG